MRPSRFSPGDLVWVGDPKHIRVEWVEHDLKLTGVVRPGTPQQLNTFGGASRVFTPLFKGEVVRFHVLLAEPRGGLPGENQWDVWDPDQQKERVFPESWLMLEAEWELTKNTKGL